jgi:type IV pilus assembly protein PilV
MAATESAMDCSFRTGSFRRNSRASAGRGGFAMLEVLVTLVILLLGLLGLIGMQVRSHQAALEAYQRNQALVLVQDMLDRMNGNRLAAKNQAYVTATALGGVGKLADCSDLNGAARDKCEWGNLLEGAAEVTLSGECSTTAGTACIGAMLGARGCVTYVTGSELKDKNGNVIAGSGIQLITVAWQGVTKFAAPNGDNDCGQGAYPAESLRRLATATLQIAALNAP